MRGAAAVSNRCCRADEAQVMGARMMDLNRLPQCTGRRFAPPCLSGRMKSPTREVLLHLLEEDGEDVADPPEMGAPGGARNWQVGQTMNPFYNSQHYHPAHPMMAMVLGMF